MKHSLNEANPCFVFFLQDDQLMGVLTVRENVMFSAELRLPLHLSKAEKQERADNVINLLVSQPSSYLASDSDRSLFKLRPIA